MVSDFAVRDTAAGAVLAVRVHPRARKTCITGVLGDGPHAAIKIALAAPPAEGRANEDLIEFLAEVFEVSRSAVQILSGAQSRNKTVRIGGKAAAEVGLRLAQLVPGRADL